MATKEQLEEIGSMIENLKAFEETLPKPYSKPKKKEGQSHAEFGLLLDKWEIDKDKYKAEFRNHRQRQWAMERKIEDSIKEYVGLSSHPRCNDIWDYIKNNFDGHGYMELLESAEELLDIFGIS